MPARGSAIATGAEYDFDVEIELACVFGDGLRPLRFEERPMDAMLAGWDAPAAVLGDDPHSGLAAPVAESVWVEP